LSGKIVFISLRLRATKLELLDKVHLLPTLCSNNSSCCDT